MLTKTMLIKRSLMCDQIKPATHILLKYMLEHYGASLSELPACSNCVYWISLEGESSLNPTGCTAKLME